MDEEDRSRFRCRVFKVVQPRDGRCGEVSRGVGLAAGSPGYVTACDLPPIRLSGGGISGFVPWMNSPHHLADIIRNIHRLRSQDQSLVIECQHQHPVMLIFLTLSWPLDLLWLQTNQILNRVSKLRASFRSRNMSSGSPFPSFHLHTHTLPHKMQPPTFSSH